MPRFIQRKSDDSPKRGKGLESAILNSVLGLILQYVATYISSKTLEEWVVMALKKVMEYYGLETSPTTVIEAMMDIVKSLFTSEQFRALRRDVDEFVASRKLLRGGILRLNQLPAGGAGGEGEWEVLDDGRRVAGTFRTKAEAERVLRDLQRGIPPPPPPPLPPSIARFAGVPATPVPSGVRRTTAPPPPPSARFAGVPATPVPSGVRRTTARAALPVPSGVRRTTARAPPPRARTTARAALPEPSVQSRITRPMTAERATREFDINPDYFARLMPASAALEPSEPFLVQNPDGSFSIAGRGRRQKKKV
jgi:hypothetical protein